MSFLAILFALLIEQARPLTRGNAVHATMRRWVRVCTRNLDAGATHHAGLTWSAAVVIPALVATGIHWLLWGAIGWAASTVWSVLVLYVTLGFRQFSHHFTAIRDALEAGDEIRARELLAHWQQRDVQELPRSEIVRQVIEYSVLSAHRHVFGVFMWFSVLAAIGLGPGGAVLFRLTEFVARYWTRQGSVQHPPVSQALQSMALGAWQWIDWLPARITALGFAVVGSFEDAIDSWRNHANRHGPLNDGVLLAATAGALNVALGIDAGAQEPVGESALPRRPLPELGHLRAVVGLVWRSVVMWMVLLALLTLARLLG